MLNKPSSRDFWAIIFKRKKAFFVLFLSIVVTITILTYVWPFTYEASAKILVKFDRVQVPLSSSANKSSETMTMRQAEEEILSEIEILNNKYLIEKVVNFFWEDLTRSYAVEPTTLWGKVKSKFKKKMLNVLDSIYEICYSLDLLQKLTPLQSQISRMQDQLKIEDIPNSNVIQVKYRDWNPELAAAVVNKLTEFYLEQHIEAHKTRRAYDFFLNQKNLLETELQEQEILLNNFKQQWNISSIELEKRLDLENLSKITLESKTLQSDIYEIDSKIESLKQGLAARTNYLKVEDINHTAISNDPVYKEIEKEIVLNVSQLSGFRAKAGKKQEQIEYYRSRISVLNENEIKLNDYMRKKEIAEGNFRRYVERLEDSRISEALDMELISNVSVIEPAVVPFSQVRTISFVPRRILHIGVGIFMGLFAGLVYVFLAESLDHTFKTCEDVERILKVPCMATISRK